MRVRTSIWLVFLVSTVWLEGCQSVPQHDIDACNGSVSGNSAEQIEQACSRAIVTSDGLDGPNTAGALVNRGAAHLRKGEMDAAISDFSAALQIDPNLAPAYVDRAVAYFSKNNVAAAQSDVERAAALRPNDAKTYNLRCWLKSVKGQDLDSALADCNEALRLSPGNARYLESLGLVQFHRRHYDEALKALNAALQSDPGTADSTNLQRASAYNLRCWINATRGQELDVALSDCNEALRLSPGDTNYLDSLGLVQFRRGQYNEALQTLNAALQTNSGAVGSSTEQRASSFYTRSLCERRLGNSAAADADLASAHAIDPDVEHLYGGLVVNSTK